MIKDYFLLLFEVMSSGINELIKILHHLYQLFKKNGGKCHRYKKMTVFDILGVVYEKTMKHDKENLVKKIIF
jgi:transketolase N-terminal domain/subunit